MKVQIQSLKQHPENTALFRDMPEEEVKALADDLKSNGLIHPIVVRKLDDDYQLISGHQRVKAAKRLGWTEMNAEVVEADDVTATRMLISANIKVRSLTPMEMARAIRRERELIEAEHGERRGRPNDEKVRHDVANIGGRWSETVAIETSMTSRHVERLDKLNDLIPELQRLVDSSALSATAAEQLAHLAEGEQRNLYKAFGDDIGSKTVSETRELRKQFEEERKAREQSEQLLKEAETKMSHWKKIADQQANQPAQIVEREVVKEVIPDHIQKKLKDSEYTISMIKGEYQQIKRKLEAAKLTSTDSFDPQVTEMQVNKLRMEAEMNVLRIKIYTDEFLSKVAAISFAKESLAAADARTKKTISDSVKSVEEAIRKIKEGLSSKIISMDAQYREV